MKKKDKPSASEPAPELTLQDALSMPFDEFKEASNALTQKEKMLLADDLLKMLFLPEHLDKAQALAASSTFPAKKGKLK